LDINQTVAEIQLAAPKLESALIALGKARQPQLPEPDTACQHVAGKRIATVKAKGAIDADQRRICLIVFR
jgi:hypothetical protein